MARLLQDVPPGWDASGGAATSRGLASADLVGVVGVSPPVSAAVPGLLHQRAGPVEQGVRVRSVPGKRGEADTDRVRLREADAHPLGYGEVIGVWGGGAADRTPAVEGQRPQCGVGVMRDW